MTTSGLSSDANSLIATDATCYNNSNNENHNSSSSVDSSGYNSSQSRKVHYEESRENNVKCGQSEMKSFINVNDGCNLNDISPMLSCIRTLSECDAIWNEDRSKIFKSLSLKQLKNENDLKEDGFYFALSLRDGSCLFTSSSITHHLGFSKDMLNGQSFMNFVFSKDHITFANHLTQGLNTCFIQNKQEKFHLGVNSFFCRLRVYQGVKLGYSVSDKKIQYKPFKITLHINELIIDDVCVEKTSTTLCVKATATAVIPAYTIPEEIPAMTSFSTRHTASCYFNHVDFSAIPYLGYLPQDMIGISIFDFYHNDDLSQLKDIYELVVKEHGSSFRSKPYRFKVQNGCYILLETEWSCFINPWSHKMEFVVGQHRILKGPSDVNIFYSNESEENIISEEILKESLKIQKDIKAILSQTMKNFGVNKSKRFCNKRKRDLASFIYNCVDEGYVGNKPKGNTDKQDFIEDRSNSDPDSVVMGDISPYRDVNDSSLSSETPPTVQQLRYQENIERFFASQPKTYSDGSDVSNKNEKSSSGEGYQGSSSGSGNVSGNTSKDPTSSKKYESKIQESSSNSSKCNMSSFTTGDSGYGKSLEKDSPANPTINHIGSCAQTWKNSNDSVKNNVEKFPSCLALTAEALSTHNRINHKHLKQHQRKNKSSMGLSNVAAIKENSWFHPKDLGHKHKKYSRNLTVSTPTQTDVHVTSAAHFPLPYQPTPVPTTAASPNTTSTPLPQVSYSCVLPPNNYSGSTPAPFFIPVVYMGSVPYYPPISTVHPQAGVPFWPTPIPTSSGEVPTPNFPFPTINPFSHHTNIPSSGMTYSGFPFLGFNPFSSIPYGVQSSGVTATSLLTTTTTTVASGATHTFQNSINNHLNEQLVISSSKVNERKQEMKSAVNKCDMQVDDTLSSSFTQSSSLQSADKEEEMDFEIKKYHCGPPRSDKIELSSDIAFCYKMHVPSIEEVLKKDMNKLKSMQQPDLVNKQLKLLQNELKSENENKVQFDDDFYMTESVVLGLATEDDVTEDLEYQEECLLRLMYEES